MVKKTTKKKHRKEHKNTTRNADKRKEFIELIRLDVSRKDAIAHTGLADSTIDDWMKREKDMSDEYQRAKTYMDVVSGQVIQEAILTKRDVKTAMEYKKRRDKRYSEKQEIDHSLTGELTTYILPKKNGTDQA